MVKFVDIDPSEIDTARLGRRGRVSYPILKAFLERNVKLSKLDLTGLEKDPTYLRSVLTAYVKNHSMPIKIFSAGGDIHLMRLDLNNDNKKIPWEPGMETTEGADGDLQNEPAEPITKKTVRKRAKKVRGKSTR